MPKLTFTSLFFNLIIQTQLESAIDRLNVLINVLDVLTDLVRTKIGGAAVPLPPWLHQCTLVYHIAIFLI